MPRKEIRTRGTNKPANNKAQLFNSALRFYIYNTEFNTTMAALCTHLCHLLRGLQNLHYALTLKSSPSNQLHIVYFDQLA